MSDPNRPDDLWARAFGLPVRVPGESEVEFRIRRRAAGEPKPIPTRPVPVHPHAHVLVQEARRRITEAVANGCGVRLTWGQCEALQDRIAALERAAARTIESLED